MKKKTNEVIGISTKNKESLIAYLKEKGIAEKGKKKNYTMLSIDGVCGKNVKYNTYAEIPEKSVKCDCKSKDYEAHYFIKYDAK